MRLPVFEDGTEAVLEQYVIRVYRRHAADPDVIVGVAHKVGTNRDRRFGSFAELKRILCAGQRCAPDKKQQVFRKAGRRPLPG